MGSNLPLGVSYMVRIIAGSDRGRRLKTPSGRGVRPTIDRVKEALFNILGDLVVDSRFLDLFAGAGGVGIEALSRGANQVVFVELDARHVEIIRENLKLCGFSDRARVYRNDAARACQILGQKGVRFDIIFADPPYGRGLHSSILGQIDQAGILRAGGVVVLEHGSRDLVPSSTAHLKFSRTERYGDTQLSFYLRQDEI